MNDPINDLDSLFAFHDSLEDEPEDGDFDEDIEFPDCDEDYEEYDGQPDEAQEWHDFDEDC